MNKILIYVKKQKKLISLGLLAATINQIFSLLNPQIFARIIDNYASRVDMLARPEFIKGVGLLLLLYVGIALVSRTAKAFQDYFVNIVSEKIGTRLYGDYVERVFRLPFAIFENEQSGSILQKMQKARDSVKKLIENSINIGFFSLVGIVFVVIYAFIINWAIAAVFLISIPVLGGIISFLGKKVKSAQQKIVAESAELAASTTETLHNVGLVKSLGLEEQEIGRLNSVNQKLFGLEINKIIILRKLSFIQGTLVNATSSLIILVSMFMVYGGSVTLGQFLTLWFYGFFVFGPLSQLSSLVSSYQEAIASVHEIQQVLEKQQTLAPTTGLSIESLETINLKNVSFRYEHSPNEALNNISLNISAGSTVALAGPSGSGKSTLLKLLLGLYTPQSGTITYNNQSDINWMSLRRQVGYVPQDSQVFAGTIRENLTFVYPEASDEECLHALHQARATGIINKTPKGLDTVVGENGIKLSGGEKQRIAIARALLRKPRLLIFDEATSSLDSLTEKDITDTIKKIRNEFPELIMIIVAHRLSTIEHADIIYTFGHGHIVESGNHQELVKNQDLYYSLWKQQQ